jgi:hypothetical protein
MQKNISIIILVIVVGAVSFYGGTKYQAAQTPVRGQFAQGQTARNGAPGVNNRIRMNGGQTIGDIISRDDKSITVKLTDGSSKIILLSTTATVGKLDTIPATDLKVGDKVGVFGTTNTDGSITAQNIQLNPLDRRPSGMSGAPQN